MQAISPIRVTGIIAIITVALLAIIQPTEAQPSKYIEGKHYVLTKKEAPTRDPGKIEITEVFWYGCPHCNQFRPIFEEWKKQQATDVDVDHSPAIWSKPMTAHAQIFYTAKALDLDEKMHKAVFDKMHKEKKRLTSDKEIKALFADFGVDEETFEKTYNSFWVRTQVQQAGQRAKDYYGINGTPEVIVNGKYRISGRMVGTHAEVLKVAEYLIEKERTASN